MIDPIVERAIDWHLAQAGMPEERWNAFVAWLEESPAHAQAYDRVAALDGDIGDARFAVRAANDDAPAPVHRSWGRGWAVGGIAAAVALVAVLVPLATQRPATTYDVATRAGERRTLTLADGTTIELSGGTRVRLDRAAPRTLKLRTGEATLHVTHDAANPFTVTSGGITVRDMGTVFDLARDGDRLSVAVSEGSVLFEPGRESVTLHAGEGLAVHESTRAIVRAWIAPESVGGWRSGVLTFSGEPIAAVFDSVHRLYGTQVVLEGDLSRRPFTGIVRLTGAADRDVPHLAALIGAQWRREGERWILASGDAASQ